MQYFHFPIDELQKEMKRVAPIVWFVKGKRKWVFSSMGGMFDCNTYIHIHIYIFIYLLAYIHAQINNIHIIYTYLSLSKRCFCTSQPYMNIPSHNYIRYISLEWLLLCWCLHCNLVEFEFQKCKCSTQSKDWLRELFLALQIYIGSAIMILLLD